MPHMHTDWSELAYQASEVLCQEGEERKGRGESPCRKKVTSARGLEAKLKRGTNSFALFLELMSVLGVDAPPEWQAITTASDLSCAAWARLLLCASLYRKHLTTRFAAWREFTQAAQNPSTAF